MRALALAVIAATEIAVHRLAASAMTILPCVLVVAIRAGITAAPRAAVSVLVPAVLAAADTVFNFVVAPAGPLPALAILPQPLRFRAVGIALAARVAFVVATAAATLLSTITLVHLYLLHRTPLRVEAYARGGYAPMIRAPHAS